MLEPAVTILILSVLVGIVLVLGVVATRLQAEVVRLRRQLEAARRLPAAGGHVSTTRFDPRVTPAMVTLVESGRTIEAIRDFRAATGAGLVEAKDAIDEVVRSRGS